MVYNTFIRAPEGFQNFVMEWTPGPPVSDVRQARDHPKSKDQRSYQRISDDVGHRRKELLFHALESEQRKICGDDDQRGEKNRPCHSNGGRQRIRFDEFFFWVLFATPQ